MKQDSFVHFCSLRSVCVWVLNHPDHVNDLCSNLIDTLHIVEPLFDILSLLELKLVCIIGHSKQTASLLL